MKKAISILLVLLLSLSALCIIPISAEEASNSEELTDYIAIKSESEFLSMKSNGAYYLANDITLSSAYANEFSGTLYGNGRSIKIADGKDIPVFNKLKGATIINLLVYGVVTITKNTSHRGGIANEGYAYFENVISQVGISTLQGTGNYDYLNYSLGGFIGQISDSTTFINCVNAGSITVVPCGRDISTSKVGFGGFAGSIITNDKKVIFKNCTNEASVTSAQQCISVGGFVGYSLDTTVEMYNCKNTEAVMGGGYNEGEGQHRGVGGFIGKIEANNNPNAKLKIHNAENTGTLRGREKYTMVGGMVGMICAFKDMEFVNCNNSGKVFCVLELWEGVGGIVGYIGNVEAPKIIFTACSNTGDVTGYQAGGILGYLHESAPNATINYERCFNTGTISAMNQYAGGVAGYMQSPNGKLVITKCVNTGLVEGTSTTCGTGGILASGEKLGSATISNCINTGRINCKNTTLTNVGLFCAGGISSRFYQTPATITNCINAGTLTHASVSANITPICPNDTSLNHTFSNNLYLSGSGGSASNANSTDLATIVRSASAALLSGLTESSYHTFTEVTKANTSLLGASSVEGLGDFATNLLICINSLQTEEEYFNSQKEAKLTDLGIKIPFASDTYLPECYNNYSAAFDKISHSISSAKNMEELNTIKVKTLLASAEALLFSVSNNGNSSSTETDNTDVINTEKNDDTSSVSNSTNNATELNTDTNYATELNTDTNDATSNASGCKTTISSAIIIFTILIVGTMAIKSKKKEA